MREMYRDLANSLERSEVPGGGRTLLRNTQLIAGGTQISRVLASTQPLPFDLSARREHTLLKTALLSICTCIRSPKIKNDFQMLRILLLQSDVQMIS